MKKTIRIVFIIVLMLSTVITLAFMGLRKNQTRPRGGSRSQGNTSAKSAPSLTIEGGDFALQTGQSHQCAARLSGADGNASVIWSSTDPRVAVIDDSGRVTAAAPGEAKIIAVAGPDLKAHLNVSVYDDFSAAAEAAVSALASDGSDESMDRLRVMAVRLGHSGSAQAAPALAVLRNLLAVADAGADGSGDVPTLYAALVKSARNAGMDSLTGNVLRRASLLAWCQGEKNAAALTVSFAGDCTFAYYNEENGPGLFPAVYQNSGSVTYPFDLTKQVFAADDITMINFEGTLTQSRRHKDKQFFFRGEPSYVDILTRSSVEAVTVENNHTFDYYDTGYNDTIDTLRDAGVKYTSYYSPALLYVNGIRIVMLSMKMIHSDYTDEFREHVENAVAQYRQDGTVIIMNVHWGEELEKKPLASQVEAAHAMIDAGVDMIVGHHPHVLQGAELYKGRYIFYSIGNFSFGGNKNARNPRTVILRAMFSKDGGGKISPARVTVIPCLTTSSGSAKNNYRPLPVFGTEGKAVADLILSRSKGLGDGVNSLSWHGIP